MTRIESTESPDVAPFPIPSKGDQGFIVVRDQRPLSVREWVTVRIFRRPDPRVHVYTVTAG